MVFNCRANFGVLAGISLLLTDSAGTDRADSSAALVAGVPFHVVGVYDGTRLVIYLNGKQNGTLTTAAATANAIDTLYLGAWSTGTNNPLDGWIGQALVWNRALTASEAKSLYDKPFDLFQRDPVRRYPPKLSGTAYFMTISLSSASGVSVASRAVARTIPVSDASGVSIASRAVARTVPLSGASAVTLKRDLTRTIPLAEASAVSITSRAVARTIPVSSASAVTLGRSVTRSIALSSASAVTLARAAGRTIALSTSSTVAIVNRAVGRTIPVASASATTLTQHMALARTITVASGSAVSVVKKVTRLISLASASVLSLVAVRPQAPRTVSPTYAEFTNNGQTSVAIGGTGQTSATTNDGRTSVGIP